MIKFRVNCSCGGSIDASCDLQSVAQQLLDTFNQQHKGHGDTVLLEPSDMRTLSGQSILLCSGEKEAPTTTLHAVQDLPRRCRDIKGVDAGRHCSGCVKRVDDTYVCGGAPYDSAHCNSCPASSKYNG